MNGRLFFCSYFFFSSVCTLKREAEKILLVQERKVKMVCPNVLWKHLVRESVLSGNLFCP